MRVKIRHTDAAAQAVLLRANHFLPHGGVLAVPVALASLTPWPRRVNQVQIQVIEPEVTEGLIGVAPNVPGSLHLGRQL